MNKLLVMTDLHIVAQGETIIGIDPAIRLRSALKHAYRTHGDAKCLLLTGDLTHHGTQVEYERLRDILAEFPLPIHMTLGNHDDRENFLRVFPDTPLADGFVQNAFDLDGYRLIILDSLDQSPDNPIHHSGLICPTRMAWLQSELRAAEDKEVLIFIHHPPMSVGFDGMDRIGLRNRQELRDLLNEFGNIRHIIAGHVHRTISGSVEGLSFSIFKSPSHQMPMIEKSDDSALSVDEPGAYGILRLSQNRVIVHSEDFDIAAASGKPKSDPASQ